MKIGIVSTWFPAGAGYVSKAYREILEQDNEVYIYARQGKVMKGDSIWDDENVYWAKFHYNGIDLIDFKRWIKRKKIEIIIFNEQRYWEPVLAAKKIGVFVGAYIDYYKEDTIELHKVYDFVICNTKRHLGVFNWHPNCIYIPWGTDVNKFKPSERKKNDKVKFIFSLGWGGNSLIDRRGFSIMLQAFSGINKDCELLIYSQVSFPELLPKWRDIITNDKRISFIYGTYDPFPFSNGDVFVYPSKLDGIGLSLPEAISCGLPSITTNNPPMSEFIQDQYNGILIDVQHYHSRFDGYYWPLSICNAESLSAAFLTYINNAELLDIHSKNARDFAINKLDWKNNSKNLNLIIENIYNNNTTKPVSLEVEREILNIDKGYNPKISYRILIILKDIISQSSIVRAFIKYISKRAS